MVKNKYRKNRISVIIVILLAFLFTIIYLTFASLTNHNSSYSNLVETGIHFHGENMRFSSSCIYNTGQEFDISISDNMQNYESAHLKRVLAFSGVFQHNSKRPFGLWITERSFQIPHVYINPDMYKLNIGNTCQRAGWHNSNNSLTMLGFNSQVFSLDLFPFKKRKSTPLISSRNDTTLLHNGFFSLRSFPAYSPGILFENKYGVQNDIIDPGDPPDGDAIPVPDGFYFLLFLGVIYTSWKIKILLAKKGKIKYYGNKNRANLNLKLFSESKSTNH